MYLKLRKHRNLGRKCSRRARGTSFQREAVVSVLSRLRNFTYHWYDTKKMSANCLRLCPIKKKKKVQSASALPVDPGSAATSEFRESACAFSIQEEIRSRAFHTSISPVNGSISFYSPSLSLSLSLFFFSFRGSRSIEVCRILTHENGPKGCASHDRCSIRSETTETARQIIYS